MKLVIIESPYNADTDKGIFDNIEYARRCIRRSLSLGEAPIASHLLYTQPGILLDKIPEERKWGMEAGHAWLKVADLVAVYTDKGISHGMERGIIRAEKENIVVVYRTLNL